VQRDRVLEHGVAEPDDLVDRLPLDAQHHEEGRKLGIGHGTGHDLLHAPRSIRHAQVFALEQRVQDFGPVLEQRHDSILMFGIHGGFPGVMQAGLGFPYLSTPTRSPVMTKTRACFQP
jgi:hypothetical protein